MSKRNKIIYWISTIWLALGMLSSGIVQLLHIPTEVEFMAHIGYPVYFLTMLGVWKILGVAALLSPRHLYLKEWAYAGFFFTMSGAIYSHLASGDAITATIPAILLLVLTVVSYYFRPIEKRLVPASK